VPFLSLAHWPKELPLQAPPGHLDEEAEADNIMVDLDDFGPSPETVLQLDDRHVSFLEEPDRAEEGEVERLLSLVDQADPAKLI
jgi:hypothetical protein